MGVPTRSYFKLPSILLSLAEQLLLSSTSLIDYGIGQQHVVNLEGVKMDLLQPYFKKVYCVHPEVSVPE